MAKNSKLACAVFVFGHAATQVCVRVTSHGRVCVQVNGRWRAADAATRAALERRAGPGGGEWETCARTRAAYRALTCGI